MASDPFTRGKESINDHVNERTTLSKQPLEAEGWVRRFVADAERAREVEDLYSKLGYDVQSVPVEPGEFQGDCLGCQAVAYFRFRTIYTRLKNHSNSSGNRRGAINP